MQRSILPFLTLICTAFLSCLTGGLLFIRAFQAGDCDGGCNISKLILVVACAFIAFLGIGNTLMKYQASKGRNTYTSLVILSIITVAVPGLLFFWRSLESESLRTNQDNSYMLIATRDLPNLGIATGNRCIFSTVDCSTSPARIHAICTEGAMTLEEPQWIAFQRLPQEDFGIPPSGTVQMFPNSCPKP
ncbi:hypothetical protein [Acidovorax sp. NCPPB 4044]|uniref:hypothetical protein n=1 Tax=Acidovorax sp. NCPPB 4044 TaxID=2940490 RepID=UPI00230211B8|nr:hypothetical protein [Acidovorax sp. NCPPB 4044]MDA8522653.1 hypothetical protein [Acidovorax sp. NCPPB 4044]